MDLIESFKVAKELLCTTHPCLKDIRNKNRVTEYYRVKLTKEFRDQWAKEHPVHETEQVVCGDPDCHHDIKRHWCGFKGCDVKGCLCENFNHDCPFHEVAYGMEDSYLEHGCRCKYPRVMEVHVVNKKTGKRKIKTIIFDGKINRGNQKS